MSLRPELGPFGILNPHPIATLDVSGSINSSTNYQIQGSQILGAQGGGNLFVGLMAGTNNNGGTTNTFAGDHAGFSNTTGGANTFLGASNGLSNTTGAFDTFVGASAGANNTNGTDDVFLGTTAGQDNTTGNFNTFVGFASGVNNNVGIENTYLGANTGNANIDANNNTLIGYAAGQVNLAPDNTFIGSSAGVSNSSGESNTFVGKQAGINNVSGSNNTFIGANAGTNNVIGNGNLYLGHTGVSDESSTIRIGQGQSTSYIAGVFNSTVSNGVSVFINPQGQLGTQTSSIRFKEQVRNMGDSSDALMKLRPVTFLYKPEYDKGERTLQYGLIAEEVAKVYPELVAYDKDGQPYSVRYQYLSTMLLNEVQKQYRRAEAEAEVIKTQEQKINDLEQRLSRLESLVGTRTSSAQVESEHGTGPGQ
jgi:hypothetical protein